MRALEPKMVGKELLPIIGSKVWAGPQLCSKLFKIELSYKHALYFSGRIGFNDAKVEASSGVAISDWVALREDAGIIETVARKKWGRESREYAIAIGYAAEEKFRKLGLLPIAEEASVDWKLISFFFMVGAETGALIQSLLIAYSTGGWPCGWRGNFPDGNMILYWPYDAAPVIKE